MSTFRNKKNTQTIINNNVTTTVITQNYQSSIRAAAGHLILSSSNGSIITISGNLVLHSGSSTQQYIEGKGTSGRGYRLYPLGDQGFAAPGLKINTEGGASTANLMIDQDLLVENGGGPISMALGNAGSIISGPAGLRLNTTGKITWRATTDIGTASIVSQLYIGRHDTGSLYISGSGKNALVAKDVHLTLSSAMGSTVTVSGNLNVSNGITITGYESASFPSPASSGTIIYNITQKCLMIAFDGAFERILTGSI
jgi:hypothetical protein